MALFVPVHIIEIAIILVIVLNEMVLVLEKSIRTQAIPEPKRGLLPEPLKEHVNEHLELNRFRGFEYD